jgi:hypothetical protein
MRSQNAHEPVFRNTNRLIDSRKRVLGDQTVLRATEQQSYRGSVIRTFDLGIDRTEIKV